LKHFGFLLEDFLKIIRLQGEIFEFQFFGGLFKEKGVLKIVVWIHSKHFMLVCVLEINNSLMLKFSKKN
jgi:hypothetical protein